MIPLLPGETIRWQGRPGPGTRPDLRRPVRILVGFVFIAFALVWMERAREGGLIWLAGLPFLAIGLKIAVWQTWKPRLQAKFAHYTITNRRVLVETRWPLAGTRITDMTITPATIADSDGEDPATIALRQSVAGPRGTTQHSLVLSRVPGPEVLALIRDLQRGAA